MNNMHTKANNAKANANDGGQTFADILDAVLGGLEKKMEQEIRMIQAIDNAMEEINEQLQEHGDMVMANMEIHECTCNRQCGSVKIVVEFTAFKFEDDGLGVTEGTIETIIVAE